METALLHIVDAVRATGAPLAPDALDRIIRARNRELKGPVRAVTKKALLPFYQDVKAHDRARWERWGIDAATEQALVRTLLVKPRRTASGVATVTVLTKPWPCAGACLYCPNDVRMPKSYLADEPACQRAERAWFDPYLQVARRLSTLASMGHTVDKVELIVLGGTWSDYPAAYQTWFATELFRALNEFRDEAVRTRSVEERAARYRTAGIVCEREELAAQVADEQRAVAQGERTYNEAVARLYGCGRARTEGAAIRGGDAEGGTPDAGTPESAHACALGAKPQPAGDAADATPGEGAPASPASPASSAAWAACAAWQRGANEALEAEQQRNEQASCRCVGLVVETRPDAVDARSLALMRRIGCTKIQMGVQSLDPRILAANARGIDVARIRCAFELARAFGFKIHAHFMANLLGATPDADARDYRRLMDDPALKPDEVKLYPCALVDGTGLVAHWRDGSWRPYGEHELVDLLTRDVQATPAFVRVSRMIRDISAHDIMVGNKKVNLRQMVDAELTRRGAQVEEIRTREIALSDAAAGALALSDVAYVTTVGAEHFLQWTCDDGRIAGFLRLSLPDAAYVRAHAGELPVRAGEAMIREVHVYGRVAGIHAGGQNAQHRGLGRALVERACAIARAEGFRAINVISAVGTRDYYRRLDFRDHGMYLQRKL